MEIKYRLLIYIVYDQIYAALHESTDIISTGPGLLYGERRTSFRLIEWIVDDGKREAYARFRVLLTEQNHAVSGNVSDFFDIIHIARSSCCLCDDKNNN